MMHSRFRVHLTLALLAVLGSAAPAHAITKAAGWTARLEPASPRAGEAAQVVLEAKVEKPWHIYSLTRRADGKGPLPTTIELKPGKALEPAGAAVQPAPQREFDKGFKIEVEYYADAVAFGLPVKVKAGVSGVQKAEVEIRYQACKEGTCLPPVTTTVPVGFAVEAGAARPDHTAPVTAAPKQPPGYHAASGGPKAGGAGKTDPQGFAARIDDAKSRGLLAFLGLAVSMGFLALLTPCVFPMIPVTVSFFSKKQGEGARINVRGPVAYCLGIIGTFTLVGLGVTAVFGASGVNELATNRWVNLAMTLLFIVLALNLFGVFEIVVPGPLLEKAQSGTTKGGLIGPMAMGLVFTLSSFTCTVPFVGTLLATSAGGDKLWPLVGMIAFSAAFALPFFLLALFPGWLARMPKSGGWLVTVKAYMGFLELAAALKFLSNVDLAWHWAFLTRPVFLAVWFAIAATAACYMLGWVRLPHSPPMFKVGPIRGGIGALTAAAGLYCLMGINGSSLGWFSGLLPPRVYPGDQAEVASGGLTWLREYDAAVRVAVRENKPLFLNFTGQYCTNCRTMEDELFTRGDVARKLQRFVTVELYTDRGDPQSERYKKLQLDRYGQVTLPLYVVTAPDGKKLGEYSFNTDPRAFIAFLDLAQSRLADVARAAQ